MTRTFRIGTRGSELALVQARWVAARLAEHGVASAIEIIRTEGDDRPVDTAWGEGAFVGRIVAALLDGRVDLAVHSAKDVPTDEPDRLVIAAYPPREDPRDALACRVRGTTLATLPLGARVGTDSPRRVAFLRALRPDLELHPLHGNVDTRLAKLDRGDSDALVLAVAGLTRLGRADRIDDVLPSAAVPSAPGQGSLALQVRSDDAEAVAAVGLLDDPATRAAVEAERALLAGTGGGCRSPIGALGTVGSGVLTLVAGAGRTWTPAAGAALATSPVAWVRGAAPVADRAALAARLAARVVASRSGPRVLVGRPAGHADWMVAMLDTLGIEAVHVPAIEIRPVAPGGRLDEALRSARAGDAVAVTSPNAARTILDAAVRLEIDPRTLAWGAVGEGTAAILVDAGIPEVFVPSEPTGEALGRELPLGRDRRVLAPRADIAGSRLVEVLAARGAVVTDVVAYETHEAPASSAPLLATALDDGPIDALILTSGSTARGLLALAADDTVRARLLATPVVAAGSATAGVARGLGFATVLVAPSPSSDALAAFTAAALGASAPSSTESIPTGAAR
jgi:hydroxymethylbilane synthase